MKDNDYVNGHGVRIKVCCASCHFKEYTASGRVCSLRKRQVGSSDLCGEWVLSEGLKNAGRGGGRVKKLEFLLYVLDRTNEELVREKRASVLNQVYRAKTLAEIEEEWTKVNGSIYEL